MDVTWDTAKNQKNINKRHLPLSLGGLVLDDEMRIERHDKEHSTLNKIDGKLSEWLVGFFSWSIQRRGKYRILFPSV